MFLSVNFAANYVMDNAAYSRSSFEVPLFLSVVDHFKVFYVLRYLLHFPYIYFLIPILYKRLWHKEFGFV